MNVIVRPTGAAFRQALSEHPGRDTIDVARARRQHAAFVAALREAGAALVEMPADDELPDACFVSDALITLPRAGDPGGPAALAVATRPGAPSRRPEVASVLDTARRLVGPTCRIAEIAAPGTLDGGDVIVYGDRVAIGVSARTDRQAAEQLAGLVRAAGYRPFLCPVEGRLHLASWVTVVRSDLLIGIAGGFASLEAGGPDVAPPAQVGRIVLPDDDVVAANVLPLAGRVFLPAGHPRAVAALGDAGEDVVELDLSEFTKADGGPTCLVSHVF
ncbi:MAG: arginine deiminase family protein [Thermoleophilia bacterium]